MVDIDNPHDKFFRVSLGDAETIKEFLELKLPEEIKKDMDFDTLTEKPTSYLDEGMNDLFSDLVFTVDLKGETKGYVVNLFEHKSSVKYDASLQLLKYMVRIWDEVDDKVLPVIIPIIFYHGKREWTAPEEFIDLFASELNWSKKMIPNFKYFLSKYEQLIEKIPEITAPKLRLFVKNLHLYRSQSKQEFIIRFKDYLKELDRYYRKTGDELYFRINLIYVFHRTDLELTGEEDIIELTKKILPERSDQMETIADKLKKEGRKEGREEGEKEGIIKTIINLLEHILETEIPEEIKQKMEKKSKERLIEISANIMEINSIKDLRRELEE